MKTFKVFLNFGGASFIPAERWEQDGAWFKFYRDDSVIAEFAAMSVQKVEERAFPTESNDSAK